MSTSSTLQFVLLAIALSVTPLVRADHPPSGERDRYGSEDRGRYDDRDRAYQEEPRYDEVPYTSDNLHDDVHDAIAGVLGADAERISVTVRGGHVILSGYVRDSRARRIAHDVAHDVPGVQSVSMRRLYVSNRR